MTIPDNLRAVAATLPQLPRACSWTCRRLGRKLTRFILVASTRSQRVFLFETLPAQPFTDDPARRLARLGRVLLPPLYTVYRRTYRASTSRFGTGQQSGSNRTPLGLHQVAEKVGAGFPIGTVFESRQPIGLTWQGHPDGAIAHRILWLEGLEPGFNRGGSVDSHARYIYIHGLADEPSLGRPASRGCIHLAAADLLPLFDRVPCGTLVWITAR